MDKNDKGMMPDIAFRIMTFMMFIVDLFGHSERKFKTLGLKTGQTVVDYACGPARYIKNASEAVGPETSQQVTQMRLHP